MPDVSKIIGVETGDISKISGVEIGDITKLGGQTVSTGLDQLDNNFSMEFDGVDDYMNTGTIVGGAGDISASFWIKTSASDDWSTEYPVVMYAAGVQSYGIGHTRQDGTSDRYVKMGATLGTTALNDGNWHHLVWTREISSGYLNIYVDGNTTPELTGTFSGTYSYNFRIGSYTNSIGTATLFFDGNVDEVAYWNVVLTPTEIEDIYNATSTDKTADLSAMSTPPVVWYRMGD